MKKNKDRIENKQRNERLALEREKNMSDFTPESYPHAEFADEFVVEPKKPRIVSSNKDKMDYLTQKTHENE